MEQLPTSGPGTPTLTITRARIDEILPLRHRVLRPGLPLASAMLPADVLPETLHLAGYAGNTVVGCATFMLAAYEGESAWQLRGMASAPEWRGRGVGRALLERAASELADHPLGLWWCNARLGALGFYQTLGWTVVSEEFEIPGVGPHRRMIRRR